MGYKLTTTNGYDFFEAASAMQKEIRLGKEELALYWAYELSLKYEDFVWRRLAVIASEDIGPADSSMCVLVQTLWDQAVMVKRKANAPAERLMMSHAVIALCRAPKSRIADDLLAIVSHQIDSEHLEIPIPDYALDQHTMRGKQMKRGWDHWTTEGCRLVNEVIGLNIYKERAVEAWKRFGKLKPREKGAKEESPELWSVSD